MREYNPIQRYTEALTDAEPVLSADVWLTRGRKRSERRLLLLQEELVIAKRGTSVRPQLRLALDQLWVLSGGQEVAGEEKEEEEGSDEDRTSIILIWPTGSCVAAFGSQALKELWVGTLLGIIPSKGHRQPRLSKLGDFAAHQAPGQAGSSCSRALFGQPLAALCGEDGSLPQSIQEMLAVLHKEGPSTEGIFRRAAGGTEFRELREALDHGADVDLGSQPALLLAVILKDFLRSIPAKLLVTDLYEDWMAAMQKSGKEEKVEELKAVAEKLPGANLLLLKRLLALLQHIGHNVSSSRMTASNLAICLGPNL
ncbi:T-cell activation Rho GTPase-activating protein-like, partial [Haliaeetus albicilla]|uniref:T-cell activation Rho GTPase-activating protein-like n=1 Tax=Haliaeetus albicilla TaxID=8969 RepID=UPI0037E8A44B